MKKIISLVLALVMVFAIAASASALTGDIYEPGPTTGGVLPFTNIKLRLIESIPGGPGFGLLSLTDVAAGKAYYTNQAIYFALEYTTPDDSKVTIHEDDYDDPAILISSTNVEFWPGTFSLYTISTTAVSGGLLGGAAVLDPTNNKKVTVAVDGPINTDPDKDESVQYILVGGGIVRGTASGAIRADFAGVIGCTKFFGAVTGGNIAALLTAANLEFGDGEDAAAHPIYDGQKLIYTVEMSGTSNTIYTVEKFKQVSGVDTLVGSVSFYTDGAKTVPGSTKNVDKIEAALEGEATWLVNDTGVDISGGGSSSLQFYRADADDGLLVLSAPATDNDYAALKSLYQDVMSFFGLQFSRSGILLPIHFAQKFSTFYAVSNEVKVALSTAVATDPDLDLPPTGDAATTAGFVMIALAVVAACGLAYRKVRG